MKGSLTWIVLAGALVSVGIAVMRLGHPSKVKAQSDCTVKTLQGTYGFHIQGWILSDDKAKPAAPLAQIGLGQADGSGNMGLTLSMSVNGQVFRNAAMPMKYQINPDCSGSLAPAPGSDAGPADFILVDSGKQMFIVGTQPGLTLSGVGVRQ